MAVHRKRYQRPLGERRYRKLFIVATEGAKTEPQYFQMFESKSIHVVCLPSKRDSAPQKVLARLKRYIKEEKLKERDEAWIVVDKDHWNTEQLDFLHNWSTQRKNYGLAVSNPCFEYWLLLHFEDGYDIATANECLERLKRFLPYYTKGNVEIDKLKPGIKDAVRRAARKDQMEENWPLATGTMVYRLIQNFLDDENIQ